MDPLTIAIATFGIQKLRGKSTGRSLRDAALMATGAQLLGSTSFGQNLFGEGVGIQGFGVEGGISSFADTGIGSLLGTPQLTTAQATQQLGAGATKEQIAQAIKESGSGLRGLWSGLGTGEKLMTTAVAAPLVGSVLAGDQKLELPEGTRPEDYEKARAAAQQQIAGLGVRAAPATYTPPSFVYPYNVGGIVNVLPKFNHGGINYLPSKVTHDENDVHNYVRAQGYVEDGSGNGNKDEDTILAQLADGEFVSRADAILGAGILEGASPSNMKDMRKKGAAFFYDQQSKFKRVFDLLNASRKDN